MDGHLKIATQNLPAKKINDSIPSKFRMPTYQAFKSSPTCHTQLETPPMDTPIIINVSSHEGIGTV
jgi:hypothetical protein